MDGEPQEDILDRCIQRLLQGEPLDRVLRSYPDQQLRLRAELEPALALLQSTAPDPTPRAEYAAMNAMMRQVRTESERPELPGVFRWLGTLRARPLAFQALAVVAAISVFGSIGFGASAATGTTPEPVREIFRLSTNQASERVTGPIVSIQSSMLVVRTAAGDRSFEISSSTRIHRGNQQVDVASLAVGDTVLVIASELRDGIFVAREVRAAVPPTPTHTAAIGAPVLPQADDTATSTPHDGGDGEHEDERHDGGAVSTPAPDGHEDEAEHAGTPEVSATSSRDGDHATSTPDHEDRTSEPEHGDATPTPEHAGDGGGDGEHPDN